MTELSKQEAEERYGPLPYDLGAKVAKYRRLGNVRPLTREERLAHAAEIEKAIRAKQRAMHMPPTPAMSIPAPKTTSIARLFKYDPPIPMVGDPPFERSKGDPWANRCKAIRDQGL